MQYPPDDPSAARADAAAALLAALRDVRDANERLQFAAAFVMEAFGDTTEAETIRGRLQSCAAGLGLITTTRSCFMATTTTGLRRGRCGNLNITGTRMFA